MKFWHGVVFFIICFGQDFENIGLPSSILPGLKPPISKKLSIFAENFFIDLVVSKVLKKS